MATHLGTGRRAEDLVAAYLQTLGMRIVARNWRRPEAELDLVVLDNRVCVFVEVRSRTGLDRGHPLESINARKRAQIIRGARLHLQTAAEIPGVNAYRFDAVGVVFDPDGGQPQTDHVPDAFSVEDMFW